MTFDEYQNLAGRTVNGRLDRKEMLTDAVMGLCGEAGECIDIVKKHVSQGHPLDEDHLVEELGDVLWYAAELATVLGMHFDFAAVSNIAKLARRYPDGFSEYASLHRDGFVRADESN